LSEQHETAAPGAEVVLELDDVHAAYHGDIMVLNGLSVEVRRGQITGIIGPNGAGKSTALRTMYGFLEPSRGEVRLKGERVNGLAPSQMVRRGVAFVPQSRSLFDDLSVEDNLSLACWHFRRDRARVTRALERAYDMFPVLRERRGTLAGRMSGGQQRFLELGRAVVLEPEVVLLDEPTAMIAPRLSRELYEFIAALPAQGMTVVLVDQNVRQCTNVSDYLYVLDLGTTRAHGSREQFGGDEALRAMIQEWLDYQID
jgi:branched-chain amino acid transport system ATP-binding protein